MVEQGSHIDRTDFFNAVVREKKRFENTLDDAVAGGLNAGTDVLMSQVFEALLWLRIPMTKIVLSPQVEHVILVSTKPREYYPPENSPMDLGPTEGCSKAIKCLEMHCKLLKGSTSKEVLEVFYQEVGIRLIVYVFFPTSIQPIESLIWT
jgi:recyclin-1